MSATTAVEELAADARARFVEAFGREPAGVWSAPGRVNLIGEHTDYNQGLVLPFAIDRRTYVAIGTRDDGRARVASAISAEAVEIALREVSRDTTDGWSAYLLGTAWALGELGAAVGGFDAYVVSDVPQGAGLSSSAALECALAVGLDELGAFGIDRDLLARAASRAENEIVGAPTGILDQSASLLCARDAALFLDCRDGSHERIDLGLEAAGLGVLVIDSKVEHAHASGGYADRRASCERAAHQLGVTSLREIGVDDLDAAGERLDAETLRRVRHVVTENQRVLDTVAALRADGPRSIGELLLASHASMRDDFEISVPEIDLATETATAAGAIGARLTGGGFGGSAIALVERDRADAVAQRVRDAFAAREYAEPATFLVEASPGARRED